jgi:hypothetical protein
MDPKDPWEHRGKLDLKVFKGHQALRVNQGYLERNSR